MLTIENLEVAYFNAIQVLKGLTLSVDDSEVVALLGANGAGKTTLLKAVSGLLPLENGAIGEGRIRFQDQLINKTPPHELARAGLLHVREGRRIFTEMSVEENLISATYALTGRDAQPDFEAVYNYFPQLKDRARQTAGLLSGGELQMLAIGRALIGQPRLILLDEPSLGLAPKIVDEIFDIIARINQEQNVSILLVEQNANAAFRIAHRGYILEGGKVVLEGSVADLRRNPDIQTFYLGLGDQEDKKSFRDVKHYKRRKRWLA
ncbi:ABC transporter ATP-binding protein [Saccharospirillum salsuginis]|uniref:ABC transporter ATP-binding protein n=1 Tax=Saccharospirillum salsuginis TaxID=418750 RepID=A0A918N5C6_9GAMM|nr:ABC transporter ATP-binding protein [Saccharospirillum salsuginis]GGX38574.1 ABC transporter ATP-binding protein [Saccharospirillum salsuginis]